MPVRDPRSSALTAALVAAAWVMGLAVASERWEGTELAAVSGAWLAGTAALALLVLGLLGRRWLSRWRQRHLQPVLREVSALSERPPPSARQPLDDAVPLLNQRWLEAGRVALLAGPGVLPLRRAVAELVSTGLDVWVVGAAVRARAPFSGPGSVRFSPSAVGDEELRAWALEVLAQGRRPTLVLLPETGLEGFRLAERVEVRLERLLRRLGEPLEGGLRVLVLWRTDPDRVLVPDAVGAQGLAGVAELRMWNGRRALAPLDPPGLPLATAVARWLVSPGASLAWNRPNQRAAALASAVGSGVLYFLGALTVGAAAFLGDAREERLIGDAGQSLVGSLWSNWWVSHAVREGRPLEVLSSDLVYWPRGANLVEMFGNVGSSFLALPLQLVLGYPGYWNLFVLLSIVANGLAMRALARRLGADRSGALVAGAVFAFCPPLVAEISAGHQQVFQAFGLPLAVWAGIGTVDSETRRGELVTGACLALACLGWWIYGIAAWVLVLLVGFSRWRHADSVRRRELGLKLGRVLRWWLPTLLMAGPLVALATAERLPGLWFGSLPHELEGDFYADFVLLGLIESSLRPASLLLGDPGETFGWAPALLGIGVLITWGASPRRGRLFWPVLALLATVGAMGPYLRPQEAGGTDWTMLPGAGLFAWLPGWSRLHEPDRLLIFAAMALAVMVALSWSWGIRLVWRGSPALPALLAVAACALLPYLSEDSPVEVTVFEPPIWVEVLGEAGAVVELPIGYREETLLYQPYHLLPRLGGPGEQWRTARTAGDFPRQLLTNPFLSFLWDPGAGPPLPTAVADLREAGLRYVVAHTGWLRELAMSRPDMRVRTMLTHLQRVDQLLGPPIYRSAYVTIYRVPDEADAAEQYEAFAGSAGEGGAPPVGGP